MVKMLIPVIIIILLILSLIFLNSEKLGDREPILITDVTEAETVPCRYTANRVEFILSYFLKLKFFLTFFNHLRLTPTPVHMCLCRLLTKNGFPHACYMCDQSHSLPFIALMCILHGNRRNSFSFLRLPHLT